MKKLIVASSLTLWGLLFLAGISSAEEPLTHLQDLDGVLTAKGYKGTLVSKKQERSSKKDLAPKADFAVTVWMKSKNWEQIGDVRQLKFSASHCNDSTLPKAEFFTEAASEVQSLFPRLTGQSAPDPLLVDLKTTFIEPKYYKIPGTEKLKHLNPFEFICESRIS